jgi:hypothetical protein
MADDCTRAAPCDSVYNCKNAYTFLIAVQGLSDRCYVMFGAWQLFGMCWHIICWHMLVICIAAHYRRNILPSAFNSGLGEEEKWKKQTDVSYKREIIDHGSRPVGREEKRR